MQISWPMEEIKEKSKSEPAHYILFIKLSLRVEIAGVDDIKQGVFDLSVTDNGIVVNSGDPVPVGDSMQITATSNDPAITNFFLSDCTASNGKAAADSDYRSLEMIRNGCMVDLGNLETAIAATSPNPGQYIAYNQFGFIDGSGASSEVFFITNS